jgi:hypothetical protein
VPSIIIDNYLALKLRKPALVKFELTNEQRLYFGLNPIEPHWERTIFKGDTYRPDSILYFEGEVIKRHILSTKEQYREKQYNELTRGRTILLPKTGKGKEKKLTPSVLESRQPTGVYCDIDHLGRVFIGNYNTQTTFYDTRWEKEFGKEAATFEIKSVVTDFINSGPSQHFAEINQFKEAKRKLSKFKAGDFFVFKVSRTQYGFGRVLANIDQIKKKNTLSADHGLNLIMTKPVLVNIYAYLSETKNIDLTILQYEGSLPSDYMMDNLLLYGQFELIGYKELKPEELDFPISYGRHISAKKYTSFLQWGLIHQELPITTFNKYFVADNPFVAENSYSRKVSNPYGFYSIGFYPRYSDLLEIKNAIANNGKFDYSKNADYSTYFDLRNPANKAVLEELMIAFGLNPAKDYNDNCRLTNTIDSETPLRSL